MLVFERAPSRRDEVARYECSYSGVAGCVRLSSRGTIFFLQRILRFGGRGSQHCFAQLPRPYEGKASYLLNIQEGPSLDDAAECFLPTRVLSFFATLLCSRHTLLFYVCTLSLCVLHSPTRDHHKHQIA